ncbi:25658_t:CDS:2, partial [Gigaspora rosea]
EIKRSFLVFGFRGSFFWSFVVPDQPTIGTCYCKKYHTSFTSQFYRINHPTKIGQPSTQTTTTISAKKFKQIIQPNTKTTDDSTNSQTNPPPTQQFSNPSGELDDDVIMSDTNNIKNDSNSNSHIQQESHITTSSHITTFSYNPFQ